MGRTAAAAALLAAAGIGLQGCDRPDTTAKATVVPSPSVSSTTSDTASPNAPAAASLLPPRTGDASGTMSETIATGRIKAAIAGDPGLKDSDISVSTDNGVVTLTGTVKSADQITVATSLAQRQQGVARVEVNLTVK